MLFSFYCSSNYNTAKEMFEWEHLRVNILNKMYQQLTLTGMKVINHSMSWMVIQLIHLKLIVTVRCSHL